MLRYAERSPSAPTSADVGDSLLGFRFRRVSGLRRKLQHCRFLAFHQIGQKHHFPIRELQRIMMRPRLFLVDLPEDSGRVVNGFYR